jgi:N-acetylmuramoyl-L-alanine amidase
VCSGRLSALQPLGAAGDENPRDFMSTKPHNASSDAANTGTNLGDEAVPRHAADYVPGRQALQALLAFSALHEQIRRRASAAHAGDHRDSSEIWNTEKFVLDEVLQSVSERARHITGADGVAIALAEADSIICRAAAGSIAPEPGARLDTTSGFSGACFRSGLIVRCDDSEYDPRVDPAMCRRLGTRSMVAVPLNSRGKVIGLLEAFSSEAYGFNDSDVRSLSLLGELILAALKPEEHFPPDLSPPPAAPPNPEPEPVAAEKFYELPALNPEPPPERRTQAGAITEALERLAQQARAQEAAAPPPSPEPEAEPVRIGVPNLNEIRSVLQATDSQEDSWETETSPPVIDHAAIFFSEPPRRSRRPLLIVLVLFLLAAAAGGAWWWTQKHPWQVLHPQPKAETPSSTATEPPVPTDENSTPGPDTTAADKNSTLPQVTGIRHWSSPDSSTVAIDLQDQVQYEAHRLTDPERIYFDLHDTTLAPGVAHDIEVGDGLLVRIRVAQPSADDTRVVLETKDSPNFSVSLEPNPYRLVVEVRSVNAKPQARKGIDLFGAPDQYASNAVTRESSQDRLRVPRFRIVLDAGHGGWDLGTVGRDGLLEKDLVLDITRRLGALISKRLNAEVIYTRKDDTYLSLENRTEIANLAQADMFLSIHANYSDYPSARGVETYYSNTYSSVRARMHDPDNLGLSNVDWTNVDIREKVQESHRFALDIQRALYHSLAARNPSLPNRGVKEASFVVLTGTTMPAVLAEVSFVSSPKDATSLQSATYRQRIAESLYKGVVTYAEGLHHLNLASSIPKSSGQ